MSKPRTKIPNNSKIDMVTRKRDGHASLIAISAATTNNVRIYSRSIIDITEKFPHIVEAVERKRLPANTLVSAEILVSKNDKDLLGMMQSIMSSGVDRALQLQQESEPAEVRLFNTIAYAGKLVVEDSFAQRFELAQELVETVDDDSFGMVELLQMSFTDAQAVSNEHDWEGLVGFDSMAGSEIRLDGKFAQTPRPDGCWKWKAELDGDFVAYDWIPSTAASHAGAVKDLKIGQYDPKTGELVDCGKIGTGLSKEDRIRLVDDSLYPLVIEAKFERRFASGKLRSGRIARIRTDKQPEECIFDM